MRRRRRDDAHTSSISDENGLGVSYVANYLSNNFSNYERRCLEVYAIQIPVNASTICTGSYGTAYSCQLDEGDFFHKVSLHGDFIASSIPTHIDSEGRHIPQVLIANWKTRQQITVVPQFDKVSYIATGMTSILWILRCKSTIAH